MINEPIWKEFELIDWIRNTSQANLNDQIGIGDDAACYQPEKNMWQVTTTDTLVEGVHWPKGVITPEQLSEKILQVNLSDLAAMGAVPVRAFLNLTLPKNIEISFIEKFCGNLLKRLKRFGIQLVGGDTTAITGPMVITMTLQGIAKKQELIQRKGAKTGDLILVTGDLGAAAAGLALTKRPKLQELWTDVLRERFFQPKARLAESRLLVQSKKITSMIDLSDGLAGDIRKIAKESKVGATIFAAHLPVSMATHLAAHHLKKNVLQWVLSGGEDFELLFTCAPENAAEFIVNLHEKENCQCSIIGEITTKRKGLNLILPNGQQQALPEGWSHQGESN